MLIIIIIIIVFLNYNYIILPITVLIHRKYRIFDLDLNTFCFCLILNKIWNPIIPINIVLNMSSKIVLIKKEIKIKFPGIIIIYYFGFIYLYILNCFSKSLSPKLFKIYLNIEDFNCFLTPLFYQRSQAKQNIKKSIIMIILLAFIGK